MTDDERSVYERLQTWAQRLNALMGRYGQRAFISAAEIDEARAEYRAIKQGLHDEYKRSDTIRGRRELTPAEDRWYQRAIHQASAHLRAPINSRSEKWFSSLYDSYSDISLVLSRMREAYVVTDEKGE